MLLRTSVDIQASVPCVGAVLARALAAGPSHIWGGGGGEHQAVEDRALGDVLVEQDELVIRERQIFPEIQAP